MVAFATENSFSLWAEPVELSLVVLLSRGLSMPFYFLAGLSSESTRLAAIYRVT